MCSDELESDRSSDDSALESDDDEEATATNGVDAELVGSLTRALGDAAVADESDAVSSFFPFPSCFDDLLIYYSPIACSVDRINAFKLIATEYGFVGER